MFIDKYLQVPRILNPIVLALDGIQQLKRDPFVYKYIEDAFGGVDALEKEILGHFFRSGFDGSGADSFFDAGYAFVNFWHSANKWSSCIDGRLTSAWNYANNIAKTPYYNVFKLAVSFTYAFAF